jgi:hypothetical protein
MASGITRIVAGSRLAVVVVNHVDVCVTESTNVIGRDGLRVVESFLTAHIVAGNVPEAC